MSPLAAPATAVAAASPCNAVKTSMILVINRANVRNQVHCSRRKTLRRKKDEGEAKAVPVAVELVAAAVVERDWMLGTQT